MCIRDRFELLAHQPEFLENKVYLGSYDEEWSLREVAICGSGGLF